MGFCTLGNIHSKIKKIHLLIFLCDLEKHEFDLDQAISSMSWRCQCYCNLLFEKKHRKSQNDRIIFKCRRILIINISFDLLGNLVTYMYRGYSHTRQIALNLIHNMQIKRTILLT